VASTDLAHGAARELRAFLYSFHNDRAGTFWPIFSGATSIGRAGSGEQVDIEIADPTTSSKHCILTSDAVGRVTITDTGSTNGTFVNDQAIGYQGTAELRDGDRIRLGGYNASIRFANR
jgi:pSer/pThr/pTyr-binding forkhead associated (FHA) protein